MSDFLSLSKTTREGGQSRSVPFMVCMVSSGSSCLRGFVLFILIVCLVGIYGEDQQLISLITWFPLFQEAGWRSLAHLASVLLQSHQLSSPTCSVPSSLPWLTSASTEHSTWFPLALFCHLQDHSGIQLIFRMCFSRTTKWKTRRWRRHTCFLPLLPESSIYSSSFLWVRILET